MERLHAILRIAAAAARYVLGGYCLVAAGQTAIQIAALIAEGETAPWKIGSWLLIALLVGATGPLVALRRPASAWTLLTATTIMTAALFLGLGGAPADAASSERLAATVMIGAMLLMTGSVFGLTRLPDTDRTI
ncbi:MAG: hypothetical protein GWO02_00175 [Gammaproteobacteria bacterium]|nr:hypothetical protein [Gammaproteobacteria bacterium]